MLPLFCISLVVPHWHQSEDELVIVVNPLFGKTMPKVISPQAMKKKPSFERKLRESWKKFIVDKGDDKGDEVRAWIASGMTLWEGASLCRWPLIVT